MLAVAAAYEAFNKDQANPANRILLAMALRPASYQVAI
jgi:hypothetical protein